MLFRSTLPPATPTNFRVFSRFDADETPRAGLDGKFHAGAASFFSILCHLVVVQAQLLIIYATDQLFQLFFSILPWNFLINEIAMIKNIVTMKL